MKKTKFFVFITSILAMTALSGCGQLHVHDYGGEYFHNETEHWQICSKCGEKINFEKHSFNQLNDTCLVCKYLDPICVSNDDHHMTGLTPFGKTKLEVNVPKGVTYIDNGSFKDSEAVTVNLTRDIIGIYKDAFTGSKVNTINTEEELVNWVEYNGIYYKDDILKNYEALIDGTAYQKIEDAFNDVKADDTTITILKTEMKIGRPININHTITLESYHSECKLEANFNIGPNGWLNIPASITYSGHTKLLLTEASELCGDKVKQVITTGSLIFAKKGEKPENVQVSYVNKFEEEENLRPVKGHKQIINEALVIPTDYYIYGTFVFSRDFKTIFGLTPFAKNISELTITNLIENDDTVVDIADFGFNTLGRMDIDIGIKTITVRLQVQKGKFHHLIIDDHIGRIGEAAFTTRVSHDTSAELRKMIALLTSPLYTVELGDDVYSIEKQCFEDCTNITSIKGGKGLKHIANLAFNSCANLKSVDFSQCLQLNHIGEDAFKDDLELKNVVMPVDGWDFGGHGYLPDDMTPELTAHYLVNMYRTNNWNRSLGGTVCLYNPNEKDGNGRYNKVKYYQNFADALNAAEDGRHIFLTDKAAEEMNNTYINHKLVVEATANKAFIFTGDITIEKNSYLILPDTVSFDNNINIRLKNKSNSGNNYEEQGGLAIKQTVNDKNNLPKVSFWNGMEACSSIGKINNDIYSAWGLFNFKVNNGVGDENKETILGYSKLGERFTEFTIDHQIVETEPDKRFIWINDKAFYQIHNNNFNTVTLGDNVIHVNNYAFEGCYNLKKLVFGKNIRWIGTKAFFTCKNLVDVDFSRSSDLNEFGENSFAECYALKEIVLCKEKNLPLYSIKDRAFEKTALERFDLGPSYQGWKHNGTAIPEADCQDPLVFAQYLRTKFPTHNYTR